ncbi:MAG: hypothetical protein K8W52_13900 [Deltaproteobacteria bacterium]|nr:hypothetical protein [Deltaproteobacteria bacterium]
MRVAGRAAAATGVLALGAALLIGRAGADDPGWELRAGDLALASGASGAVSLTIAPAAGKTVSADGPVRVDVVAVDGGVGVPRRRYTRKDAADPAADAPRFDLKVRALTAGDHDLAIDVRFWLCGARICAPVRAHRTVTIHVAAPPDAMPPDARPPPDAPPPDGRRR